MDELLRTGTIVNFDETLDEMGFGRDLYGATTAYLEHNSLLLDHILADTDNIDRVMRVAATYVYTAIDDAIFAKSR